MSELKVNFLKSKIYGVNVSNDFLDGASDFLYCYSAMIPFKFLGIPIGARWKNNFDKCSAIQSTCIHVFCYDVLFVGAYGLLKIKRTFKDQSVI